MNFNTIKQELHKKIKKMSEDEFIKFIEELKRIYYKNKYTIVCRACDLTVEEAIKIFNEEQNAYKEGYDACKRIMAREKQFNSYCPRCMGKLETCEDAIHREREQAYMQGYEDASKNFRREYSEDCISRKEVNDLVDELARAISDERCNVLRKRSPAIIMHAILKLPSVKPEPFINKPCVSEQACHEDKVKVLEKIKAEIEAKCCITVGRECDGAITLHDVFEIIDKYKAESEDKE